MATFQISGPGGAEYEIDAPDEARAMQAYRSIIGGGAGGASASASSTRHDMTLADGTTPPMIGDGPKDVGTTYAALRGVLNGVPVVGPSIVSGVERAAAGIGALRNDTRYSDTLSEVQANSKATAEAHPYVTAGSEMTGGVLGTLPLVAAAPAAFGAGAGGLGARSLASMASGAVLGGADTAARTGGDLNAARQGAQWGGALGLASPAVGQAVGRGIGLLSEDIAARLSPVPGMRSSAAGKLADDLRSSGGLDPVRARLGELGPDAMLLDASPSFEGRAQGLAVLPDTRDAITAPLTARASGANARLGTDVDRHLGPNVDPAAFRGSLDAAYEQAVPPLYRQSLAQPLQVDTSDVLATIRRLGETEKGGAANALRAAWGLLHAEGDVPGVGRALIPDRRPEALHNVKEALDGMIARAQAQQGSAAASEVGALTAVRRGVNDALEAQVPGYRDANRTAQGYFQQGEAFDRGQTLLNAGREAVRPAQLATETAAMSPEIASAQRAGLRTEIDRLVGTRANDRAALQGAIQGEGDFNRARLATVFGEEPTAGLVGAVERERAFDATTNRIANNSMTELRRRAADDIAPRAVREGLIDGTPGIATAIAGPVAGATALGGRAAIGGARMAASAIGRQRDIARNREIADALVKTGDPMEVLLQALGVRLTAAQRAQGAGTLTDRVVRAVLQSQGDRSRRMVPSGFLGHQP
ncbi:hypothetical protein ASG52_24760 [Methylobacterium sp. Leaf456]|uniref:hypothetical protein n=1 Tax=Methylobacterium sp. Leaf456 TaxID=1736382 RepID=UPI0006F7F658|nr:hypothetical protein [Methylobacterium sp. Leaf456]KQT55417.1 hypothetical protein ASG52_24760 [Methylobacterium sp. Leaf456]